MAEHEQHLEHVFLARGVWRYGLPWVAATLVFVPIAQPRAIWPIVGAVAVVSLIAVRAWTVRIVVRGSDLFQRGWFGWRKPLLLDHLAAASCEWEGGRDPHRVARFDDGQAAVAVSLRWHERPRDLLRLIVVHLADEQGNVRPEIDVDDFSVRRLSKLTGVVLQPAPMDVSDLAHLADRI